MSKQVRIRGIIFLSTIMILFNSPANAQTSISDCSTLQNINPAGAYVLVADFSCSSEANFLPIANFTGTLDGQGHTISDLTINRPAQSGVGLFASIENGGTVSNLNIVNANVTGLSQVGVFSGYLFLSDVSNISVSNSQVSGASRVGGLIGESYNGIGIYSSTVNNVTVNGTDEVGGIVGRIWDGTINNIVQSSVNATVIGTNNVGGMAGYSKSGDFVESHSTGSVQGDTNVGGIVGYTYENAGIRDCYAKNTVSGNQLVGGIAGLFDSYDDGVHNTYFAGTVSGNSLVGGFLGQYSRGVVSSNYWDTTLNPGLPGVASGVAGGIEGKTTAEMFAQSTFAGWDFVTIWGINANYPYFLREFQPFPYITQIGYSNTMDGAQNMTLFQADETLYIIGNNKDLDFANPDTFIRILLNVEGETEPRFNQRYFANDLTVLPSGFFQIPVNLGNMFSPDETAAVEVIVRGRIKVPGDTNIKLFTHKSAINIIPVFVCAGDNLTNLPFAGGDGTTENPYIICTLEQLDNIRMGVENYLDDHFELHADIDAFATSSWNGGAGFEPIGNCGPDNKCDDLGDNVGFSGSFNGNFYAISNLYINRPGTRGAGLFGFASNATISNLVLQNVDISATSHAGGLLGYTVGSTIKKTSTSGLVRVTDVTVGGLIGATFGGAVQESSSSADVSSTGWGAAAGLVYHTNTDISDCYSTGTVSGTNIIAGLVGVNAGELTNSYSTSNVQIAGSIGGGLVGNNHVNMLNTFTTANLVPGSARGGLIGNNFANATPIGKVPVLNAWWDNRAGNPTNCYSGGDTGCTTIPVSGDQTYFYDNANAPLDQWDFDNVWTSPAGGGFPILKWQE